MSNKVYVLIKDLPTLKAGECFVNDGKFYYYPKKYPVGQSLPDNGHGVTFTINDVENNPEWFMEVQEIPKTYTEEDMRLCFYAARKKMCDRFDEPANQCPLYSTFNGYLNSLQQKNKT